MLFPRFQDIRAVEVMPSDPQRSTLIYQISEHPQEAMAELKEMCVRADPDDTIILGATDHVFGGIMNYPRSLSDVKQHYGL